jgi:hypothetical protein
VGADVNACDHQPLDVICGGELGIAIAGALNLAFGVPESP